jgi:hypothetical protein
MFGTADVVTADVVCLFVFSPPLFWVGVRRENDGSSNITNHRCLSMSSRDTAKGEKTPTQKSKVRAAVNQTGLSYCTAP